MTTPCHSSGGLYKPMTVRCWSAAPAQATLAVSRFNVKCRLRADGPRNLIKMAQHKMVTAWSCEVATLNGAVEAVEMSDPERAPSRE